MKRFEFRDSSELYTYIHTLFVSKVRNKVGTILGLLSKYYRKRVAQEFLRSAKLKT